MLVVFKHLKLGNRNNTETFNLFIDALYRSKIQSQIKVVLPLSTASKIFACNTCYEIGKVRVMPGELVMESIVRAA